MAHGLTDLTSENQDFARGPRSYRVTDAGRMRVGVLPSEARIASVFRTSLCLLLEISPRESLGRPSTAKYVQKRYGADRSGA
jgi:hypothetical protein